MVPFSVQRQMVLLQNDCEHIGLSFRSRLLFYSR